MQHAYINTSTGTEESTERKILVYVISSFGSTEMWQITRRILSLLYLANFPSLAVKLCILFKEASGIHK